MDRKNFKMILIILCIIIISGIFFINKLLYIKTMALLPVSYPVIVIDPGHGGVDPGAIGPSSILEKDINLQIALKLYTLIEEWGGTAVLTRDKDVGLYSDDQYYLAKEKQEDLLNRVEKAGYLANILLSIHMNAHPSPKWYGAQVFYHKIQRMEKSLQDLYKRNW